MIPASSVQDTFRKRFGYEPTHAFFCPGRVNLIGEHIDYNGGYVFPAGVSMGITAAVARRADNKFRIYSTNIGTEKYFNLGTEARQDSLGWANYVKGMLLFLQQGGLVLPGLDISLEGDLPHGAGLSSSAALEVLIGYIAQRMAGRADKEVDRTALALLGRRVENEYIGVNSGIMDQFAVANAQAGQAILLDCETLAYEQVPLDLGECALVILNTNKERKLADSKYNQRRAECDKVLEMLKTEYDYPNLCAADMAEVERMVPDPILQKRAHHVITEQQRVLAAVVVLKAGNLDAFGKLLSASHQSLKEDYEVTGRELDAIVAAAQAQPGCLGARMTGAGFGGCALALVKKANLPDFDQQVAKAYRQATGLDAGFYHSAAEAGVREL